MRRAAIAIFCFILLLSLFGCHTPTTEDEVYDFILSLPKALRSFQLQVIDLSDPDAFQYLGRGWHLPRPGGIPLTRFLWSSDEISEVFFDVKQIEALELLISVRPFVFEGSPEMSLDLHWNNTYLGNIMLSRNWEVYRLDIPEKSINIGKNRLIIHHSNTFVPAEIRQSSSDHRRLGASYAYFVLRKRKSPVPAGKNYTLPQILGEHDIVYAGSLKHVMYDTPPAEFRFNLDLPSKPVLSFGAGILPDTIDTSCGKSRFKIRITSRKTGKTETIFALALSPPSRELEKGWNMYSRDLKSYAGQPVTITFETSTEGPECPGKNGGSWLSPLILNRHVKINLILLIGSGPDWPPKQPVTDSSLGVLKQLSWVNETFSAETSRPDVWLPLKQSPLPVTMVNILKKEGWQTGYFFSGRDELWIEDTLSRDFDAVCGTDSVLPEDVYAIQNECFDWLNRLKMQNFALAFDPALTEFSPGLQTQVMSQVADALLEHLYQVDTLFIVYNPSGRHPVWVHLPGEESTAGKDLHIETLDDLFEFILHFMEVPGPEFRNQ